LDYEAENYHAEPQRGREASGMEAATRKTGNGNEEQASGNEKKVLNTLTEPFYHIAKPSHLIRSHNKYLPSELQPHKKLALLILSQTRHPAFITTLPASQLALLEPARFILPTNLPSHPSVRPSPEHVFLPSHPSNTISSIQ